MSRKHTHAHTHVHIACACRVTGHSPLTHPNFNIIHKSVPVMMKMATFVSLCHFHKDWNFFFVFHFCLDQHVNKAQMKWSSDKEIKASLDQVTLPCIVFSVCFYVLWTNIFFSSLVVSDERIHKDRLMPKNNKYWDVSRLTYPSSKWHHWWKWWPFHKLGLHCDECDKTQKWASAWTNDKETLPKIMMFEVNSC